MSSLEEKTKHLFEDKGVQNKSYIDKVKSYIAPAAVAAGAFLNSSIIYAAEKTAMINKDDEGLEEATDCLAYMGGVIVLLLLATMTYNHVTRSWYDDDDEDPY